MMFLFVLSFAAGTYLLLQSLLWLLLFITKEK